MWNENFIFGEGLPSIAVGTGDTAPETVTGAVHRHAQCLPLPLRQLRGVLQCTREPTPFALHRLSWVGVEARIDKSGGEPDNDNDDQHFSQRKARMAMGARTGAD